MSEATIIDTHKVHGENFGGAKIVDTKKMIEQHENADRIEKIVRTKKLNKVAEQEFAQDFENKNKNPFVNMKIPRARGKGGARKGKKPVIDFEKFTVNQYTYEEFSKAVNTVLPNIIDHVSFKDPKFLEKLRKSKDIKHFSSEQIMFPITNDYLGFLSAVVGCGVEYYVENKLPQPSKEEPSQMIYHKNNNDSVENNSTLIV